MAGPKVQLEIEMWIARGERARQPLLKYDDCIVWSLNYNAAFLAIYIRILSPLSSHVTEQTVKVATIL